MSEYIRPAIPFDEVNAALDEICAGARAILGDRMIGMYVHGSLAIGDFDPERSDIDFLIVTADPLSEKHLSAIAAMHARIAATGLKWSTNVEGSYFPAQALRLHDPSDARHPALRTDGSFGIDGHCSEWIVQRHVIREKGIVWSGPDPETLIEPISSRELRRAVIRLLHEWWEPQLTEPFRLADSEYQAYAVLTMCRALYTIRHGTVVSKPVAGQWAKKELDKRWAALIDLALAWRHGVSMEEMSSVIDFIRFTLGAVDRLAEDGA